MKSSNGGKSEDSLEAIDEHDPKHDPNVTRCSKNACVGFPVFGLRN